MSKRILLIEDDTEISELLCTLLKSEGFEVVPAYDGEQGEQRGLESKFDLIVLDIMLPKKDGLEVLRSLRSQINTPIMMLTAKGEDIDRIVGFEMGADDYLPKPFNPRELVARLKALLRRIQLDTGAPEPEALSAHNLVIKPKSREVFKDDKPIELTSAEYMVLLTLIRKSNEIVSKSDLTEIALSRKLTLYDRAIDMHVSNLRKKTASEHIKTVRGVGYMYQDSGNNHA